MEDKIQKIDARWNEVKPKRWRKSAQSSERQMLHVVLQDGELPDCLIKGTFHPEAMQRNDVAVAGIVVATNIRLLAVGVGGMRGTPTFTAVEYDQIANVTHHAGRLNSKIHIADESLSRSYVIEGIRDKASVKPFVDYLLAHVKEKPSEAEAASIEIEHAQSRSSFARDPSDPRPEKEQYVDQRWRELNPAWTIANRYHQESQLLHEPLGEEESIEGVVGGRYAVRPDHDSPEDAMVDGVVVATDSRLVLVSATSPSAKVTTLPYESIRYVSYAAGFPTVSLQVTQLIGSIVRVENILERDSASALVSYVRSRINRNG